MEFALISMVLMTLLFGILQYGWYFYSAQSASSVARETARRLVVGDCTAGTEARDFAASQAALSSLDLKFGTPASMNNTLPPIGTMMRVEVSADAKILGVLPLPNGGTVTRTVDAMVEDDSADQPCT